MEEREREVEIENKLNSLTTMAVLLGYEVDIYNVSAVRPYACRQIHLNLQKDEKLIEFIFHIFTDSRRLHYYEILIEDDHNIHVHRRNEHIAQKYLDKVLEII